MLEKVGLLLLCFIVENVREFDEDDLHLGIRAVALYHRHRGRPLPASIMAETMIWWR